MKYLHELIGEDLLRLDEMRRQDPKIDLLIKNHLQEFEDDCSQEEIKPAQ